MNEDKPGTQENKQSAFKDKTVLNDNAISPHNSTLNLVHLKFRSVQCRSIKEQKGV